ncbi:hypothetical protein Q5P01_013696 [Channa striata]|uniref:T-cell surface glycoprotein CD3 zeta chain n=1 Tax=Channa striata TaxID=64152 RepID=A0AA88SQV6_CHASR|nr:hypothetical protein Q5P01_013696 [Channa striata]
MDKLRTDVFLLLVLTAPVSCYEVFFTDPVICYFLDGFLVVYCLVATALFFREKFSHVPVGVPEDFNGIYQELERPKDADPYQVLEPLKKKKKAGKKKKAQSSEDSLNPPPPPPLSPQ